MNRVILDPVSKRFVNTGEKELSFILCQTCGQPKPRRYPAYNKKHPLCVKCGREIARIASLGNQGGKLRHYPEITLSDDQEQIIIGSTLGDGGLYLGGNSVHYRFQVAHSEKDGNYLYWKYNHLPPKLFRKPPFKTTQSLTDKNGIHFHAINLRTIQHPLFDQYHTLLYNKDGKKSITTKVLDSIKPLGLAIWYQDDGSLYFPYHGKPSIRLAICKSDLDEAELIHAWLQDKFGIKNSINKKPPKTCIRIHSESSFEFLEIVEPFIILERKSGRYNPEKQQRKLREVNKRVILDPITKKFTQVGNNVKNRG